MQLVDELKSNTKQDTQCTYAAIHVCMYVPYETNQVREHHVPVT